MHTELSTLEKNELVAAVKQAGAHILKHWKRGGPPDLSNAPETKIDGTSVTEIDLESDRIITDALRRIFPQDSILSEESPINLELLRQSDRTWVLDPLDGTNSFLNGRDDFSVILALCKALQPIYTAQFFPVLGFLVLAEKGHGCFVKGQRCLVSSSKELLPNSIYIRNFECTLSAYACGYMDSGLALFKVAKGELIGAIIKMTTHREWDIAAAILCVNEAGGKVTDENGHDVPCATGTIKFNYFVASNGTLHEKLLQFIPT